ncbi:hypothetical protein GRB29_01345 [Streptococcus pneumoniae]|nr:hypothetical protein [Streptococcus pneumoniae]
MRAILAYAFAATAIGILWPTFAAPFGAWAGVVAGAVVIGPVWYLVHYRGLIPQGSERKAVDMGGAIGTSVLVKTALSSDSQALFQALPTLLLVLIGAALAGCLMAYLERRWSDEHV